MRSVWYCVQSNAATAVCILDSCTAAVDSVPAGKGSPRNRCRMVIGYAPGLTSVCSSAGLPSQVIAQRVNSCREGTSQRSGGVRVRLAAANRSASTPVEGAEAATAANRRPMKRARKSSLTSSESGEPRSVLYAGLLRMLQTCIISPCRYQHSRRTHCRHVFQETWFVDFVGNGYSTCQEIVSLGQRQQ